MHLNKNTYRYPNHEKAHKTPVGGDISCYVAAS